MILFIADKVDGGGAENQMLEELAIQSKYYKILLITKAQPKNETILFLEKYNIQFLGSIDNNLPVSFVNKYNISLIHAHNIWDLKTQFYIKEINIKPIVMTIHDYRILCPTGWKIQPNENVECLQRSEVFCQKAECFQKKYTDNTNASNQWFSQYQWLKQNINGYAIVNKHLLQRMMEDNFQNLHNINYPLSKYSNFSNNQRQKRVAYAGIIAEHKGILRLINTIKLLQQIDSNIEFLIIGTGNLESMVNTELSCYPNVFFKKELTIEEIYSLFSSCSVVYLPSKWLENFNLIARYARIVGTPILVPKISGFMQRLNKGISEFYIPTEIENDAFQIKNMVDKVMNLQKGSIEDRNDEIEQSSVSIFLKQIQNLYKSVGVNFN